MTLDRRITGGLAWAGLLVVVGVPSADALTSYLSNRDASVLPAVVAPASQAAPVAAKLVAEVQPATTKPAVVQQVAAAKPQAAPTAADATSAICAPMAWRSTSSTSAAMRRTRPLPGPWSARAWASAP